jgi:hypothetical protein
MSIMGFADSGIVPETPKPTENETELRATLKIALLPFGYVTEDKLDQIMSLITSDKQRLLIELIEHKIYGHLAVPGCTEFVPVSAIQNKLEGLS